MPAVGSHSPKAYQGGSWKNWSKFFARHSGSWKRPISVHVKSGGAWVKVYDERPFLSIQSRNSFFDGDAWVNQTYFSVSANGFQTTISYSHTTETNTVNVDETTGSILVQNRTSSPYQYVFITATNSSGSVSGS